MNAKEAALTAERLRELLEYNEETGEFRWRVDRRGTAKSGSVAGSLTTSNYCTIRIDCEAYQAHRLVWLYVHGSWPADQIDHINGIRYDNRIVNLREATKSENGGNQRKAQVGNKTGMLGVYWKSGNKKFASCIQSKGKSAHLGYFSSAEEAYQAYLAAKRELHPFNTL